MLGTGTVLFLMALLLVAVFLEPLATRLRLPFSVVLIIIGFIGAQIVVKQFAIDTGIRWDNFGTIIFYCILPILIFQSALNLDIKTLLDNIIPISLLALPLMLISLLIIATCLYYSINHPAGFPWMAALITGALLSATDPTAILNLLKRTKAPKRLSLLLAWEGLFNDATAVVVFSLFIAIATENYADTSFSGVLLHFITVILGGLLLGMILGLGINVMTGLINTQSLSLLSVICAYGAFIIAEDLLSVSGAMAVLATGLTIGPALRWENPRVHHDFVIKLWGLLGHIAESTIFLLAGITITLSMFREQYLAIVIGIIAVLIARMIMVFGLFPLMHALPNVKTFPLKQQAILVWGGVRGTITLALALSLPLSLSYWYTIQSVAYGVVLFSLFVQATTITPLVQRLHQHG